MMSKSTNQDEPILIRLPLFLTESLLPLQAGPKISTRAYQRCFITIQGGAVKGEMIPLPSGILSRRLLFYFLTTAWEQRNPKIEIKGTQSLLKAIGISPTAQTRRRLKRELVRLSKAFITIDSYPGITGDESEDYEGKNIRLMDGIRLYNLDSPAQLNLFKSYVEFAPEFYKLLIDLRKKHTPLHMDRVWAIDSALATDVYCWLQRRIQHADTIPYKDLTWDNIYAQFGRGEQLSKFKTAFRKAMTLASGQIEMPKVRQFENPQVPIMETKTGVRIYAGPSQVKPKKSRQF